LINGTSAKSIKDKAGRKFAGQGQLFADAAWLGLKTRGIASFAIKESLK